MTRSISDHTGIIQLPPHRAIVGLQCRLKDLQMVWLGERSPMYKHLPITKAAQCRHVSCVRTDGPTPCCGVVTVMYCGEPLIQLASVEDDILP